MATAGQSNGERTAVAVERRGNQGACTFTFVRREVSQTANSGSCFIFNRPSRIRITTMTRCGYICR